MDDFFNAAQKLTAGQGDNKQYGFVMPRGTSEGVYFLVHLLGAAAAQGSGETLKPNFTDPNAVQAIRKVVDLLKNDTPHTWLDDYSRASAFISCWTRPSPSMVQWSGSPCSTTAQHAWHRSRRPTMAGAVCV